tara:strand:- start:8566 stop:8901 length:336 start_codon:yes stop_codon:yes gene_type:complete
VEQKKFYIVKARQKGVDVTWWDYQEDEIIVEARSPKEAARMVYSNSENRFAENKAKLSATLTHWNAEARDYDPPSLPSRFYAWNNGKVIKVTAFEYYNAKNLVVGKLIENP